MSRTSALGTKLTALAMSTLLATSTPLTATVAYAEENSDDADATVEQDAAQAPKDEIVYTRTDATGAASGTYVVNYFNTPQAVEVADPGTYDKVTNLSTTEQLEDANGTVNLTTLAGQPFYYQGDLADGTQLPWKVDITYTLDGKEVSPEDLSGADGDLDIELKIAGLDDDSATADFAKSFVLQAQGTFADANFNLTDAGDATISTVGDKTLVTYLQLPGTDGDYHIKGKATDFTYSGWQIAAMPLSLDLNVADYDTSQLTDAAGELESATTQLADGGSSLRSGLSQLNTGASTAATGATTLSNGANTLAAGTSQLANGTQQVNNGAASLRAALTTEGRDANGKATTFYTGVSDVATGADKLNSGVNALLTQLNGAASSLGSLNTDLATINTNINSMSSDMQSIQTDARTYGQSLLTDATKASQDASALDSFDVAGLQQASAGVSDGLSGAKTNLGTAGSELQSACKALNGTDTARTDASAQLTAMKATIDSLPDGEAKKALQKEYNALAGDVSTMSKGIQTADVYVTNAGDSVTTAGGNVRSVANNFQTINGMVGPETLGKVAALKKDLEPVKTDLMNISTIPGRSATVLQTANDTMKTATTLSQTANTTVNMLTSPQAKAGMSQLQTGANALATGADQLQAQLEQGGEVYNGVSALTAGTQQVVSGAAQVNSGASQVSGGASQLSSGLSTLSAGTQTAYTGSGTLSDGLNQLRDAVSGMDRKVLDEVQETIDEKLGTGYQLHSFVDAGNTDVNEVQFVYVVDGVEDPGDSDDAAAETAADADDDSSQTFTQRLVALFKHDDE